VDKLVSKKFRDQKEQQKRKQQGEEQQQQQQQQQLQFQGPTTVALPAAITWATASTNHRGSVSASGIPLPTPTPTLQAQAVTPCLGDQRNDLRQKDWPCQHPPGATVSPAESAVRQRTSRVPQRRNWDQLHCPCGQHPTHHLAASALGNLQVG